MDQDSDDNPLNGDSDKQILAPSEGPRESLINTAVKFLQNPKVLSSPLYQKKAFLEKKGLTTEEINIAVQRSGVKESTDLVTDSGIRSTQNFHHVTPYNSQPPQTVVSIPPQSAWAKTRDLTLTTVIVASISYATYHFFQKYLRSWLLGKTIQEKRFERLESQILENQKSIADSLAEVNKTLVAIQASLNSQQKQSPAGYEKGISDLKTDMASLKSLFLSRNQFPPAPTTSPVLPSWQRAQPESQPLQPEPESTDVKSYSEVLKMSPSADQKSEITDTRQEIGEDVI